MTNHYDTLGLPHDADKPAIKRAYFALVKTHTPDGDPEGFRTLRAAYETLTDDAKRAEYDLLFGSPEHLRDELIGARELIALAKYKQAIKELTALQGKNPDDTAVSLMLGKAYYKNGNYGKAITVYEKILAADSGNFEAGLGWANSLNARGYNMKADDAYDMLTQAHKNEPDAWYYCIQFLFDYHPYKALQKIEEAVSVSEDMFKNEYFIYLQGANECNAFDMNKTAEKLFNKFTECFLADKRPERHVYNSAVNVIINIVIAKGNFFPSIEKILPAILESGYRQPSHEESLQRIQREIQTIKFMRDKRFGSDFKDLVGTTASGCDCETCAHNRNVIEHNLAMDPVPARKQIKALQADFPLLFKLNEAYYLDMLDVKKEDYLQAKYEAIARKDKKGERRNNTIIKNEIDEQDDWWRAETTEPFVRDTPKIGRNAPCPCGSGKKYKHCCGKGA